MTLDSPTEAPHIGVGEAADGHQRACSLEFRHSVKSSDKTEKITQVAIQTILNLII